MTIERLPDFLKRVIFSDKSRNFILHIEFQTADDAEMPARMLEYHGLLYRKYKLPVIQQVFYIGTGSSKMKNKIEHPNISFSFGLMSFQEISYLEFIDSEIPEEIMLAILANFEGEKAEIIITEILTKIERQQIVTLLKKKTVRQLSILSRLRN